jgi:2-C-methyl-D-erythritol 4-phosphate cytidylyltransferase
LNEGWDGAIPGLPLADTVKRVREGSVVETLPRDELAAVQTPQAFVASVLREAVAGGVEATDCASLVEARGGRVRIVEGDPRLLKVTTPADLALVESWLDS